MMVMVKNHAFFFLMSMYNKSIMKFIEINMPYDKSLEKQFRSLEFSVPSGTDQMEISWSVEGADPRNSVDLAIEDPFRFRGWSGYSFREILLDSIRATPGYIPGPLPEGLWRCRLGFPKVYSSGVVTVRISFRRDEEQWFPGDLHLHSIHSGDGTYTIPELQHYAEERGLAFLALTDHNAQTQNDDIPLSSKVLMIPSVELTTYKGHSNFWNLDKKLEQMICDKVQNVSSCVQKAREEGAVISMNHPFAPDRWDWGYGFPFDAVEIWNSLWTDSDRKALAWWHNQLCQGRILCAVGGSDTHNVEKSNRDFGLPVNWIRAERLEKNALMQGIRSRHVIVSESVNAPRPELEIGELSTGDKGPFTDGEVRVRIFQPAAGRLLLFSDQGMEKSFPLSGSDKNLLFPVNRDRHFYRVEIRNNADELLAAGNPILNSNYI